MKTEDIDKIVESWDKVNLIYYEVCAIIIETEIELNGEKAYTGDIRSIAFRLKLALNHFSKTIESFEERGIFIGKGSENA